MLYTVSQSPYACDIKALLRTTASGDDILLISDGVTAGIIGSPSMILLINSSMTIYGLKNDIIARALSSYFAPSIHVISYTGFVNLTEKNSCQFSW